jgi:hypothetical protein
VKVFIDGRCLVYGDKIIGEAIQVEEGKEGWEDVLDRHNVQMLLVRYRKRDSAHLFASRRWRCVYWDDVAVIGLRDDVFEARRDGLREFPLSNPTVFHDRLPDADPTAMLAELDAVLARDPECWTAHAFRTQALLRAAEAQPSQAAQLRSEALGEANRAVELQKWHAEPWRALQAAAEATGDAALAARAERKAAGLPAR